MPSRTTLALATALSLTAVTSLGATSTEAASHTNSASPIIRTAAPNPALAKALNGAASSRYLRGKLSGYVTDISTNTRIWNHNATIKRLPASTQKLITALTVLDAIPNGTQLITTTTQSTAKPTNIYLKGAGDPTLTSERLTTLAKRTAAALKNKKHTSINLYVDSSAFPAPTNASGWKTSYVPTEVQPVRGLTLYGYKGTDNDLAAGRALSKALTANGITVKTLSRATAPAARQQLSASWSASTSTMVATMLNTSNNTYAEYLLRQAAATRGTPPTWNAATANAHKSLTKYRINTTGLTIKDGSGLSRGTRMPVATLTGTIRTLHSKPSMNTVAFDISAMPRAGSTGTLANRFAIPSQRCARNAVIAKTGTLGDVVSLAGIAKARSGRTYAFTFLVNNVTDIGATRIAIDRAATTLVGCK
ncbi:D-alanyl-D-alanine carboxypeptidase/D-alanyl-D-alanine-endopeptidase [Dermatophilus congolensis]|uniref:D-alanyl-D-alanine carboxypeptidase/D-alanyl-D-alanine endopeptidase n=1 Tax=Dermatophilus congolensis TaxID=1863 RepID=UPI001AB05FD9|nr:D-alanyl-D-alanine carboxypeptidase/D-alanyl-D-alanine-endopeptidase [Dermatophilus congolensis]MBO3193781.1 D-alanyl-D-alanine carboxypeptidase/D-alanyl-D-alanine-endopeptidase [Dermatophilus congolensis]